jgi:hypothetical protein
MRAAEAKAPALPHAPELGRSRRLLGRFHVTGLFWYRLHLWGVSHLPSWAVAPFVLLFTAFFFLVLLRIRRAPAANLVPVLGPCGWLERQRRIWRTLWNQAWCNTERYERLTTGRTFEIAAEGLEHWRAATGGTAGSGTAGGVTVGGGGSGSGTAGDGEAGAAGTGDGPGASELAPRPEAAPRARGMVLATAHVGAWDVSSFLPSLIEARPVHVVREQEMDPAAQELIEELYRERTAGSFTLHFSRNNPALAGVLLGALRRGEIVGVQGDRPSSTGRAVETELFGRPFPLPAGPAALARAARVPRVPGFCFRQGRRRYRLVVRPPIDAAPTGDPDADRDQTIQALAREIEWAIRERPHQWFCFKNLWGS